MDEKITATPVARAAPDAGKAASNTSLPIAARGFFARHRWLVIGLGGAALLGLALLWWEGHQKPSIHYITLPLARGDITRSVTATGTVNPELTIIVGAYVSGTIQALFCDYNTVVRAGQICAKIDPRPYQAVYDQYAGQLARDQAILAKDRNNLDRFQKLAEQNSIARQQAEDQAYIVNQDEATVKLDQGLVSGARLNLAYTDIVAPVDGTVVSRNVTQGQTVASSFQTPTLFLIATDLAKMQVDTNTSESDIGGLKTGNPATFTVDAYAKRTFNGKVAQVRQSPQTVQNVVTFDAVISVPNADFALMPGMTASTRIIIAQRKDVLRVPNQALRYVPGGPGGNGTPAAIAPSGGETGRLFVLRDGTPAAVPVQLGLDDDNFTEVLGGDVRPGEAVIIGEERGAEHGSGHLPLPRL